MSVSVNGTCLVKYRSHAMTESRLLSMDLPSNVGASSVFGITVSLQGRCAFLTASEGYMQQSKNIVVFSQLRRPALQKLKTSQCCHHQLDR